VVVVEAIFMSRGEGGKEASRGCTTNDIIIIISPRADAKDPRDKEKNEEEREGKMEISNFPLSYSYSFSSFSLCVHFSLFLFSFLSFPEKRRRRRRALVRQLPNRERERERERKLSLFRPQSHSTTTTITYSIRASEKRRNGNVAPLFLPPSLPPSLPCLFYSLYCVCKEENLVGNRKRYCRQQQEHTVCLWVCVHERERERERERTSVLQLLHRLLRGCTTLTTLHAHTYTAVKN